MIDPIPIRVVGRIVYDRPGIDRSDPPDGDFDDEEETPPVAVGADSMWVVLHDLDTLDFETIWLGTTNTYGFFDSGVIMWDDCEIIPLPPFYDCDTPDLVLRVSTFSPDIVAVVDVDLDTYTFSIPEIEDFAGDFHDYGTLRPDAGVMPAFHIHNNVVHATRFVLDEGASQSNLVAVVWPDTNGSRYC